MSPVRMARMEAAIRLVLEFNEAFNRHDTEGMLRLISEECVFEHSGPLPDGTSYRGKKEICRFWKKCFRTAPDIQCEIEEIFGAATRCIVRRRYRGTNASEEGDGIRGVDIFQVRNGSLCEILSYVKSGARRV